MASMLLEAVPTTSTSMSTTTVVLGERKTINLANNAAPIVADNKDVVNNRNWHSCVNDSNFGVICVFLQKFSKDLGLEMPNFKHLEEWLINAEEVTPELRSLHIKLLRKTRKTVHEKSWESALCKFCWTYSAQDAWELERFGYKKSSLKVKLRILKELLESQFERNGKFRAKIVSMGADTLRMQPIGRDRLGYAYWLTYDDYANLRIYQEHLDEENWQVVATNREEFVQLIDRLKGNEEVLPCADIGIDEDSSNSCSEAVEKPPPPEEQEDDDSQEEQIRVPNLRIKLSNDGKTGSVNSSTGNSRDNSNDKLDESATVQPLLISQAKIVSIASTSPKTQNKRLIEAIDEVRTQYDGNEKDEEIHVPKKPRPTLLNPKRPKKACKYEQERAYEDGEEDSCEDDFEETSEVGVDEEEEAEEEEADEEDIDSAAADEGEDDQIEESDNEDDDDNIVSKIIEDPVVIVRGRGSGNSCEAGNLLWERQKDFAHKQFFTHFDTLEIEEHTPSFSEVITEPILYVISEGVGFDCLVGNNKNTAEKTPEEPKATFFFGEPGCLKLSPIKIKPKETIEKQIFVQNEKNANEEIMKPIENTKASNDTLKATALAPVPTIDTNNSHQSACTENTDSKSANANTDAFMTQQITKENNSITMITHIPCPEKADVSTTEEAAQTKAHNLNSAEISTKKEEIKVAREEVTAKVDFLDGEETVLKVTTVKPEDKIAKFSFSCEDSTKQGEIDIENQAKDKTSYQQVEETKSVNIVENQNTLDMIQVMEVKQIDVEVKDERGEKNTEVKQHMLTNMVDENFKEDLKIKEIPVTASSLKNEKETNPEKINMDNLLKPSVPANTADENEIIVKDSQSDNDVKTDMSSSETCMEMKEDNYMERVKNMPAAQIKTEKELQQSMVTITCEEADKVIDLKGTEAVKQNKIGDTSSPVPNRSDTIIADNKEKLDMKNIDNVEEIPQNIVKAEVEQLEDCDIIEDASMEMVTGSAIFIFDQAKATTSNTVLATKLGNRKRRLAEPSNNRCQQNQQQRTTSTSESEIDLPSSENNEEIGIADESTDLDVGGKRLKIRAKVSNVELRKKVEALKTAREETSSSSEEDANKQRKLVASKCSMQQKNDEKLVQLKRNALPNEHSISALTTTITSIVSKSKPSLEEIIEKKLKKTPEKPSSSNLIVASKKTQIIKPLKKNLLTQLSHEESDEEEIPRKRSISETVAVPKVAVGGQATEELNPKLHSVKEQFEDQKNPEKQRKRRNSGIADKLDQMPSPVLTQSSCQEEGVSEKLKKSEDNEISNIEVVKGDIFMTKANEGAESEAAAFAAAPMVSRRSSRRVGTEVIHTELPLVKRTRGTSNASKVQIKKVNSDVTEKTVEKFPAQIIAVEKQDVIEQSVVKSIGKIVDKSLNKGNVEKPPMASLKAVERKNVKSSAVVENKEVIVKSQKKSETNWKKDAATTVTIATKTKSNPQKKQSVAATVTTKSSSETPKEDTLVNKFLTPLTKADNSKAAKKSQAISTASAVTSTTTKTVATNSRRREVDTTNIIESTETETPVRQSRRIAQQKIREEAERRKLEEIALRSMKQELKKKKKAEKQADPTVVPSDEPSSSSADASEDGSSVATEKTRQKRGKKKCPGKDGTWSSGSEEQDEPEEEEVFEPPHESDGGSSLFKSDHEFSPESELEDETQQVPMRRARTVRKEDADECDVGNEEESCQKCSKSDHPEWILLCDNCDKGYHCSCLSPMLFYIPEGDWFCPPCQQEQLIIALEQQLREFDELVEHNRLVEEQKRKLAEQAAREQRELEEQQKLRKSQKKFKQKYGEDDDEVDDECSSGTNNDDADNSADASVANKQKYAPHSGSHQHSGDDAAPTTSKRISDRGKRRRNRRLFRRDSRRRHHRNGSDSGSVPSSDTNNAVGGRSSNSSTSSTSSTATDSDDEPIYKLRKRRQINVSYRLNEFDDLINSALKKEMDEVAGAGNLGRGKDISTILEADKEEKARIKRKEEEFNIATMVTMDVVDNSEPKKEANESNAALSDDDDDDDDVPLKPKTTVGIANSTSAAKQAKTSLLKKKPRKLTTLDISSEEDHGSDEDFKTSSFEDDEDEDTSISVSTESDSSLEIYRRRGRVGKSQRKAARRAARERRKDCKFVVDDSEEEDDIEETRKKKSSRNKKKRSDDTDYTESTGDEDDISDLSENVDSADLCDDTTSDESDGAWMPNKRKKQRKGSSGINATNSGKVPKTAHSKKPTAQAVKKQKRLEYSDDDISESTEEEEEDDDDYANGGGGGKGSGKQPRSQPLIPNKGSNSKTSTTTQAACKKKKKLLAEHSSYSDNSEDSTPRTRGRRYAYLEDFDDDSSDGGIKPGVQRPDTPPEERQKFIQKQEEIKRMLAEKNAEGAKLAATPRLTPIKADGEAKDKRSPAKQSTGGGGGGDSLSTVPLSVIRQAKALDIDYLQRKGENVDDIEAEDVDDDFDDADLPDDLPDDMDEDAIARMVDDEDDEDEDYSTRGVLIAASDETMPLKMVKDKLLPPLIGGTNPSLAALAQMHTTPTPGLQEPMRKRLPMPTLHPPLLRHQFPTTVHMGMSSTGMSAHMQHRHGSTGTHLLQSALSAPLRTPLNRNFPNAPLMALRAPAPVTAQIDVTDAKPRGRRKKITPLRDALQKQQAAAAAAAIATAAAHAASTITAKERSAPTGAEVAVIATTTGGGAKTTPISVAPTASLASAVGVIKSALSVVQPPQLFKSSSPGNNSTEMTPMSVITRMAHLPTPLLNPQPPSAPGGVYATAGNSAPRFYGNPTAASVSAAQRARAAVLQMPPGMSVAPPAHSVMRPTYGPPPQLRVAGSGGVTNQSTLHAAIRGAPSASFAQTEHMPYGAPPPARHAAGHLSAYRQPPPPAIYGNPQNFMPRATVVAPPPLPATTLRSGGAPEFASRAYGPYGYYSPPPPLTTPPTPASSSQPSSVIVSATASTLIAANHGTTRTVSADKSQLSSSPVPPSLEIKPTPMENNKKLITLDSYTADSNSGGKSPLHIGGESSGSHSSPGVAGAEDSPTVATHVQSANASGVADGGASEFSGLVSYFSSQHDDYNS